MSKGFYVGVSDKAIKIKHGHIGVDGVARRINKAYIGVDGVARLFYQRQAEMPYENGAWIDMAYGNGIIVAAGERQSKFATSTDGITWNSEMEHSYLLPRLSFAYDKFICAEGMSSSSSSNLGTVLYSYDGKSWMKTSIPNCHDIADIVYGNGVYVATGGQWGIISGYSVASAAYSTDGINWTACDRSQFIYADNNEVRSFDDVGLVFFNGQFITAKHSDDLSKTYIFSSQDGINWQKVISLNEKCNRIVSGDNCVLLFSEVGSVYRFTNETNFTKVAEIKFSDNGYDFINSYLCPSYGNEMFLVHGHTTVTVDSVTSLYSGMLYSTDGVSWSHINLPDGFLSNCIKWVGNKFIALGWMNLGVDAVWESTDGINWYRWSA